MKAAIACIGLGSNLAHPRSQVARARRAISRLPGSTLKGFSPLYVSAPVDCTQPQPDYVNAVAVITTTLRPRALLDQLLAIERRQKRQRGGEVPRNAPRTLDLDLLLYGRRRIHCPQLCVPHPRMHGRAFVLRPLLDVLPTVTIPGIGLARWRLRSVCGQQIVRTRAMSRAERQITSWTSISVAT